MLKQRGERIGALWRNLQFRLHRLRHIDVRNLRRPTISELKETGLRTITALARTPLPEIMFVSTFIISRFLPNADFSYPNELIMPIVLFGLLVTIFFYAFRRIFGRVLTAHLATLPMAWYFYHYQDMSRIGYKFFGPLLPNGWETPFTLSAFYILGFAVFFGALAWGIVKLFSRWPKLAIDLTLTKIGLFIITFNFLVQAVVAANYWFVTRSQLAYKPNIALPAQKTKPASKPNIYYLIFDRYTGNETLQKVYGYDNSDLLQFLADQQFVTRQTAYANYPYTMSSVGSTLNMSYLKDLNQFAGTSKQTGFPYRALLNDPLVVKALRQNGYEYNIVNSWWDFVRIGVKPDRSPTMSFRLRILGRDFYQSDFSRDIINRSVLAPILNKGVGIGPVYALKYELDRSPQQNFRAQLAALKQQAAAGYDKPQFTFAQILMPHDPYVFMPDGGDTAYSNDRNDDGADENVKYINQLKYTNSQIKQLIQSIKKNDPRAIIVLQADEGPYPKEFRGNLSMTNYFDPKNLKADSMRQKFSVMASYYFPGVDQAEVAANVTGNVNTFRYILTKYLGYDLPPLPDCQISMGNKFNLYSYTLLNKRLKGSDAPECEQYL